MAFADLVNTFMPSATGVAHAGIGFGAPLAGIAAALTNYEGAFLFSAVIALLAVATIAFAVPTRRRPQLA